MLPNTICAPEGKSPPSRGAWIEIHITPRLGVPLQVAPLAGGVD